MARDPDHDEEPTVRDIATVTVSETVDGRKRRRQPRSYRRLASTTHETKADPLLMAAVAKVTVRPGERLKMINETTYITVYE